MIILIMPMKYVLYRVWVVYYGCVEFAPIVEYKDGCTVYNLSASLFKRGCGGDMLSLVLATAISERYSQS